MRVSPAQQRVLADLAAGGKGYGVEPTVVPLRCLVRDGLVEWRVPRLGEGAVGYWLTDLGWQTVHALALVAPEPIDLDALPGGIQ